MLDPTSPTIRSSPAVGSSQVPFDEGSGRGLGARRTCPACGARDTVNDGAARGYRLHRCVSCGLKWRVDLPTPAELEVLYSTGFYVGGSPRGGPLIGALHSLNNQVRLREIGDLPPGRLLDVGSGKGRFLDAARHVGWDVRGVEFAPASAEATQAAYGIEVVVGDFLHAPLDWGYDVVTMWHVLEHLPDPAAALRRAHGLLRIGGRLVISVPNVDSTQARFGGNDWFHLDPPRHLFHFGPRSLGAMVARCGFRVDRIGHLYPEMEFIGLIQTTLSRAGLRDDLLYRFAKRDPTAAVGWQVAASAAIALGLTPAAIAWTLLAPALRTGASIQLVAHRE